MDDPLKKLNYKPPAPVTVVAPPRELAAVLDRWAAHVTVRRRLGKGEEFVVELVRTTADSMAND